MSVGERGVTSNYYVLMTDDRLKGGFSKQEVLEMAKYSSNQYSSTEVIIINKGDSN